WVEQVVGLVRRSVRRPLDGAGFRTLVELGVRWFGFSSSSFRESCSGLGGPSIAHIGLGLLICLGRAAGSWRAGRLAGGTRPRLLQRRDPAADGRDHAALLLITGIRAVRHF